MQHNRPDATFFIKILKESNKLNQYFKDFKKNFRNSDFLTTEEKNRKHMNYFRVIWNDQRSDAQLQWNLTV